MHKPSVGNLILISWFDIQVCHGWEPLSHDPGIAPCKTVGFVTHVSDSHVSVAATMGVDSVKNHTTTETNLRQGIPWGCVTSWVRLVPRRQTK